MPVPLSMMDGAKPADIKRLAVVFVDNQLELQTEAPAEVARNAAEGGAAVAR